MPQVHAELIDFLSACGVSIETVRSAANIGQVDRWASETVPKLAGTRLSIDDLQLVGRFPADIRQFVVSSVISAIYGRTSGGHQVRLNKLSAYLEDFTRAQTQVQETYDHGGYRTYIFPEESALIYVLVRLLRPRKIVIAGSYYGFMVAPLLFAPPTTLRHMVYVDPDTRCLELARKNVEKSAFPLEYVEFVASDAQTYFADCRSDCDVDLMLLDAELPREHPDRRGSGKHIYFDIVQAAQSHLAEGAALIAHNYLMSNWFESDYFDEKCSQNAEELFPFEQLVRQRWNNVCEIPTTEGVLLATGFGTDDRPHMRQP